MIQSWMRTHASLHFATGNQFNVCSRRKVCENYRNAVTLKYFWVAFSGYRDKQIFENHDSRWNFSYVYHCLLVTKIDYFKILLFQIRKCLDGYISTYRQRSSTDRWLLKNCREIVIRMIWRIYPNIHFADVTCHCWINNAGMVTVLRDSKRIYIHRFLSYILWNGDW